MNNKEYYTDFSFSFLIVSKKVLCLRDVLFKENSKSFEFKMILITWPRVNGRGNHCKRVPPVAEINETRATHANEMFRRG